LGWAGGGGGGVFLVGGGGGSGGGGFGGGVGGLGAGFLWGWVVGGGGGGVFFPPQPPPLPFLSDLSEMNSNPNTRGFLLRPSMLFSSPSAPRFLPSDLSPALFKQENLLAFTSSHVVLFLPLFRTWPPLGLFLPPAHRKGLPVVVFSPHSLHLLLADPMRSS